MRGLAASGVLLLVAAAFRLPLLTQNRFHPDEALYASFGLRIASGQDPWLSTALVDKPPLGLYLTAAAFAVFGRSEFAARIPSFFAGLLSIALVYRLARRLYASRMTAGMAAVLLSLSPLAISFSGTLFLDTLLAPAVLWGLWAASARRPRLAGLAFGIAFLVKQSALLFLPLGLALLALHDTVPPAPASRWRHLLTTTAIVTGFVLAALAWDFARSADIGFWHQGYIDNMPDRLIRSGEMLPRLRAWTGLVHSLTDSYAVGVMALAGLALLIWRPTRHEPWRRSLHALIDLTLIGFAFVYLAIYWLLAFNLWDRYLVPLAPLACLLAARAIQSIWAAIGKAWAAPVLILGLMAGPAFTASRSGYPLGGDHGAYDGIDAMAGVIASMPAGSVLYDHWLSWQWNFYLFDAGTYVVWLPSPGALADDLRAFGGASAQRLFVVPGWEVATEWQRAAEGAGFAMQPIHWVSDRNGKISFTLYRFLADDVWNTVHK